jgi:hypothetical protein
VLYSASNLLKRPNHYGKPHRNTDTVGKDLGLPSGFCVRLEEEKDDWSFIMRPQPAVFDLMETSLFLGGLRDEVAALGEEHA